METSKWVIFDPKTYKKVKTVTIKHESNLLYKEFEPFEKELNEKNLAAHEYNSLNQDYLEGKSFKEKLKILGW
jgi:predicted HTH domain antitoxin